MSALLHLGLANVVVATALALLAGAAGYWGRRPALSHALWLLVLVKLVTPPLVSVPVPWGEEQAPAPPPPEVTLYRRPAPPPPRTVEVTLWVPATANGPQLQRPALIPAGAGQPGLMIDQNDPRAMQVYEARVMSVALKPDLAPPTAAEPLPEPPAVAPAVPSGWPALFAWVWVGGAAGWFLLTGYHLFCFQRLLRHAAPAPAELQEATATLAARLGLRWAPVVSLVPGKLPPMVWMGLGRPRILLPQELLPRLSGAERDALLAHELAHVHRGDHWVRWLELLVSGLYWWLPLTWVVGKQMRAQEEECCDAWVVGELSPRAYAGAILHTLDFLADAPNALPVAATGVTRIDNLKRRLTLIMQGRTPKQMSSLSCVAVAVLGLVLLPLLPRPTPTEVPAPPPPEPAAVAAPRDVVFVAQFDRPAGVREARSARVFTQPIKVQPVPFAIPLQTQPPEGVNPEATERLWRLRLRPLERPEEEDPDD